MNKEKWKKILAAIEILGLEETVTIAELKKKYRRLSKEFHPDTAPTGDSKENGRHFQEIAKAYSIIMEYCDHYPIPFTPDEETNMSAEEFWMDRFGHDPLWGKAKETEE